MNKILLFTIAVGEDPIYLESIKRYMPYTLSALSECGNIDCLVFTDKLDVDLGKINKIKTKTVIWPYIALLKNNILKEYLDEYELWDKYTHIYFIDADFALAEPHRYTESDFTFLEPYWDSKIAGGFYGGKAMLFKEMSSCFYDEISYIVANKLPLPKNLDEHYLKLFYESHRECVNLIKMNKNINTLAFYDTEDLGQIIKTTGVRQFLHPFKGNQRANQTIVTNVNGEIIECIVNLDQEYIFNNYTYDFGRLMRIDNDTYQIFWSTKPEARESLIVSKNKIDRQRINVVQKNSTSPTVSIVMPMRNPNFAYLKECVDSVLGQSFKDFEFIIVDDGSTDHSGCEFIQAYKDPRIRLIHNEHNYINSLNTGVRAARGKYIARMDADDVMLPERLQVQVEYMEENSHIDICGSWVECMGVYSGVCRCLENHTEILSALLNNNVIFHPAVIMRAASVQHRISDLYEEEFVYAEDYRLWTQLVLDGLIFANIPFVLQKYRTHENQVTQKRKKEMRDCALRVRLDYVQTVIEKLVADNPKFKKLFDELIDLYNDDVIALDSLIATIRSLWGENNS